MLPLAFLAVAFLPGAFSQAISNAHCTVSSLSWMTNSLRQSPCDVAADLAGACNNGVFTLDSLGPGFVYLGPDKVVANSCRCSTVYYSMLSACAACQGNTWIDWTLYSFNCTTKYNTRFPQPLPTGVNVPAWAYTDIEASNNFSLSAAQNLANLPESSAQPAFTTPSSTATPTMSTFAPTNTPSSNSHAGAIAGGVIGGVVGLSLIAGLTFFFLRRRRQNASFSTTPYTPAPYTDSTPNMGYTPSTSNVLNSPQSQPQRLYNPSDPSTFPTTPIPLPSSPYSSTYTPPPSASYNPFQSSTPQVAQPHMPSTGPAPAGHYTGVPEL